MCRSNFKYSVIVALSLVIFSCTKPKDNMNEFLVSSFDKNGKSFCFAETGTMNGLDRDVCVYIPRDATKSIHTFEHYIFIANDNDLLYYQINAMYGDVVLLKSDGAQTLDTAALVVMPIYINTNYSASYYVPHKIKTDGSSDLLQALNDTLQYQTIPSYTLDPVAKTVSFYTNDLNAAYLLGSRK